MSLSDFFGYAVEVSWTALIVKRDLWWGLCCALKIPTKAQRVHDEEKDRYEFFVLHMTPNPVIVGPYALDSEQGNFKLFGPIY